MRRIGAVSLMLFLCVAASCARSENPDAINAARAHLEEDADTSLSIDDEFNLGGSTDCSGGVCDGSGGQ